MITPQNWADYELLDSGDKQKLERWGAYILARPEPQALWSKQKPELWEKADAQFTRGEKGGKWKKREGSAMPDEWTVIYGSLTFKLKPTLFKHTGIFPEQAANWEWIRAQIGAAKRPIRLLNLFAYTGGATLAAASAGAEVTHLDAASGIVEWAKENSALSNLSDKPVRWLVDDALKFIAKEARRGAKYDAIVMDPPSYGRGAKGEVWKLEDHILELIEGARGLLSEKPLFLIISSYTTGFSQTTLSNMIESVFKNPSVVHIEELGLTPKEGYAVPAGITARIVF
ncbi:MAG: class I SAM-dependent methyltransferase [Patescibacteria group bacterium]